MRKRESVGWLTVGESTSGVIYQVKETAEDGKISI